MRTIRRTEAVILTAGMLALPTLGAVALHRLSAFDWLTIDWSDPLAWVLHTPPEDMAAAILRHLGLVGCYWLSAASIAYTVGRLAGLTRIVAALGPITPRVVRSVGDRVVIGAVALSSMGISPAPAMAVDAPPPIVDPIELRATVGEVHAEPPTVAFVRQDYLPRESPSPIRAALDIHGEPHEPMPSDPDAGQQETIEVQGGDSLWLVASRHLARHLGRPATQDEIRAHWQATIDANLSNLRSGDPDLIHPGEIIILPPAREG